jgi:hypothetical protein
MFNLRSGDRSLIFISIFISLSISSCGETKYTQCEQLFQIAHNVTDTNKNVSYTSNEQPTELKSWLIAADLMNTAAQQINELQIDDAQLIEYQTGLANIYYIYSQATYNAVKARESKNINALKSARIDAQKAGELQQILIKKINIYCLNQG